MKFTFGANSNKGKVKLRNEDHFSIILPEYPGLPYFVAVSDGVGGRKGGELASVRALQTIGDFFSRQNLSNSNIKLKTTEAVKLANLDLISVSEEYKELAGMGTTIVLMIIFDGFVHVFNVGDSRGYIITKTSEIIQITTDHTWTQELVLRGQITKKEAKTHPHRHRLTRAVGVTNDIEPDYFRVPLSNIKWLLLCTDGLTEHVQNNQIIRVLERNTHPQKSVDQLVELALSRGGTDNITVVAAEIA